MSNYKEIQKKNDKDLAAHVAEKREEVRKFRFSVAGAGTRDVRAIRNAKKDIARSLTELNTRAKKTESNENSK
jgi:ribosomal protein L29